MRALIKQSGGVISVRAPLASRQAGRYDLPLPPAVADAWEGEALSDVLEFTRFLVPNGRLRASDVLLSEPGSERQAVHYDSSWDRERPGARSTTPRSPVNPKLHYATILVPLTKPSKRTGSTRVWPRTHRNRALGASALARDYADTHDVAVGDALVFDGLLAHCGLENVSEQISRYFYYAAWSAEADPNTEVTGI